MPDYVAYYRVSTDRQGKSGLGLEAQRATVNRYIRDAAPLAEFTEVESGRKHTNRPQLAAALAECRWRRGTLIIATLDRLARNVHFVSGLMESGVPFVAADAPDDPPFILHMRAAMAEEEGRKISQRTKAALNAAKSRGTRLGNPRWRESIEKARAARNPNPIPPQIVSTIERRRREGFTLRQIAEDLNSIGARTPRGNRWHPETVSNVLSKKP